jgi:hypothetical protein
MVQILGGLITYLLIVIYCRNNFNEKVPIKKIQRVESQKSRMKRPASISLPVELARIKVMHKNRQNSFIVFMRKFLAVKWFFYLLLRY